jgi:hypothetical protein
MGNDDESMRELPDGSLTRDEVNRLLDRIYEQSQTIRWFQARSRIEQEWRRDIDAAERKRRLALNDT